MDLWTFLGFVAVLALLAAIEKQLIAIHKDLVETKVKIDYISALVLKKEPASILPSGIDTKEREKIS
jgi:hypothetical protein